ncbi:MAG: peptide chain release factor N(5)-glutamine methyltransferase [Eubacteriales bacterium]|nr:peptide chain release factor N(5)-glutamine methyltransferase [Eubacteriales bacterium]
MSSFSQLLNKGTALLKESGIEEAGLDAWLLLEYTAKKSRAWYFAHKEEEVPPWQENLYQDMIHRRGRRIPLQHITGQAFFMGHEFFVNEKVLIPRQDTELLAEEALALLSDEETLEILDMCTGSGCILISLLLEKEKCRGVGADISAGALEVARRNGRALGVLDRIDFLESDLFSHEWFREEPRAFDMIVSNPPYIRTGEIEALMEEVRCHDPRIALDGREDGLSFYRRITRDCLSFLKEGGYLLYEIGYDQGEAVARIMEQEGFAGIQIKKDLAGLDRVVVGYRRKKDVR